MDAFRLSPRGDAGLYWHPQEDVLVGWCHNYQRQMDIIKTYRPAHEAKIHLQLFRLVQRGLSPALRRAMSAAEEAREAFATARNDPAVSLTTLQRAWDDRREALSIRLAACSAYKERLAAVHHLDCPNCPWDGQTIFPNY